MCYLVLRENVEYGSNVATSLFYLYVALYVALYVPLSMHVKLRISIILVTHSYMLACALLQHDPYFS